MSQPGAVWSSERSAAGAHNPWIVAGILSIATFMEVLDTSIANVALRHIAGALAASLDESTWVLTSYLVSNAVILPVSGWLSNVVGRKRFYMSSVALFTASSFLCGVAPSLGILIFARVLQGLGGGGLAPSEQSMLADSFPPEKRPQAFALYGVAVIVAPALGPTIGGYITDNASWHWIFFLNVPFGLASLTLVHFFVDEPRVLREERQALLRQGLRIDWTGFALVALALGCLEIVLDRGQEADWFSSHFIVGFAIASGLAFIAFAPWELSRRDPIVDIRLILTRQFGVCWLVMLAVGMILFSSTQFLPQLLQQNFGYTATLAGLALMPGGFAALLMMIVAGRMSAFVQPRYMMTVALLAISLATYHFTSLSSGADFRWFATARVLQIMALPMLFLTITSYSYVGLPPEKSSQASALINVARNLGGSIGVSMAQALLAQHEPSHGARPVAHVFSSSVAYRRTLSLAQRYFEAHGFSTADASGKTAAWLGVQVMNQAAYLSYIDVFAALALLALILAPIGFLLQRADLGKRSAAA